MTRMGVTCVRVTGMRYTIVLTVNRYSHVDRFFKEEITREVCCPVALKHRNTGSVSFNQLWNRALLERAEIAK